MNRGGVTRRSMNTEWYDASSLVCENNRIKYLELKLKQEKEKVRELQGNLTGRIEQIKHLDWTNDRLTCEVVSLKSRLTKLGLALERSRATGFSPKTFNPDEHNRKFKAKD